MAPGNGTNRSVWGKLLTSIRLLPDSTSTLGTSTCEMHRGICPLRLGVGGGGGKRGLQATSSLECSIASCQHILHQSLVLPVLPQDAAGPQKCPQGQNATRLLSCAPTGPESTPPVLSPPPTPEPHIRVCAPLVLSAQDNYPPHTPQEPKEPPSRSAPPSEVSDFGRCPSFTYLYPPRVLILTYFWTG